MNTSLPLIFLSIAITGAALAQSPPVNPNNPYNPANPTNPSSPASPVPPSAPGDSGQKAPRVSFDSLDANKDGTISEQEAKASLAVTAAFGTADKNGDGLLTRDEFNAYFSKL